MLCKKRMLCNRKDTPLGCFIVRNNNISYNVGEGKRKGTEVNGKEICCRKIR